MASHKSNTSGATSHTSTSGRGFAGMSADRQREVASEGGRAAHEAGTAHEWDSAEAREAGHLGGLAAHHHAAAAFHSETSAHHHRQAAEHFKRGNHEEARRHADAAHNNGRQASDANDEARFHGRGFAGMSSDRLREVSSEGGRASHASGYGHEWDSAEAREAGHRGGSAPHTEGTKDEERDGKRSSTANRGEA